MPDRCALVGFVAGSYAAIGVVAAVRPAFVPALFGGAAGTPESRTEVRAVSSGIPFAFAASLLRAEGGPATARSAVARTVRDASAGMALARLAGVALERRRQAWPIATFCALEAALAVASHRAARSPH